MTSTVDKDDISSEALATAKTTIPSQVVGNIGLYYICYQLCKRGWNVMPTSRNARGIDIVIYSQDGVRKHTIQVKSLSRRSPVPFGSNLDSYLFCRLPDNVQKRGKITNNDTDVQKIEESMKSKHDDLDMLLFPFGNLSHTSILYYYNILQHCDI